MKNTSLHTNQARCRSMCSLCLVLLVAACITAPASSNGTPTATGSAQVATSHAYHEYTSTVFAVSWSSYGTHIASASQDGTARVWDAMSGRHILPHLQLRGIS